MAYFDVTIEETLSRTIRVSAADESEAHQNIKDQYDAGDIVLDADDCIGSDITPYQAGDDSKD